MNAEELRNRFRTEPTNAEIETHEHEKMKESAARMIDAGWNPFEFSGTKRQVGRICGYYTDPHTGKKIKHVVKHY